jgi:hypothetical protein
MPLRPTSPRSKQPPQQGGGGRSPFAKIRSKLWTINDSSSSSTASSSSKVVVVGATSTLVVVIFLFTVGVTIGFVSFLYRHPQCLDPIEHSLHHEGAGWLPIELTIHNNKTAKQNE